MRHQVEPGRGVTTSSLAFDYPAGCLVPAHAHLSDQLIYATRGVMEVVVKQSCWMIPPQFALWVPAGTRHKIRMPRAVSMRTLYLRSSTAKKMPRHCAVLHVTPLLRELIIEIVRLERLRARVPVHASLQTILAAQLESARTVPTSLTLPRDARAAAVAQATMNDLIGNRPLKELCHKAGASARTIQRIFLREVGTSFELWRRQARLMKAIELLVAGFSVKETASQVGYQQTSAFVSIFRDTLGKAPKAWVADLADNSS